jgi:SAM-dependent methyltransferase
MVLLWLQNQHDLIPQAHSSQDDLKLASEIKDFRNSMFQLFQRKTEEIVSAYSGEENQEKLYLKVRHALDECPEVQKTNYHRGVLQDSLWSTVSAAIDQDRERLEDVYQRHLKGKGTLELNPDLDIPQHQLKTNIHRMPGGYLHNPEEDNFNSGVLYDHGVFLYGRGWFGSLNDELGQTLIHNVLAQYYPNFQPHTILDLGCSVGHSTLPYASAYPQAQVWGIDLGASLLRYAIARARVLNQTVYFSQQNAERTEFADQSFDLVVSHILLHEIPGVSRKRVFSESYRLLKPGGIMIHLESSLFLQPPTLVARYFRDTEVWANSEPYLGSSKFDDFLPYALEAGFAPEEFQMRYVPGYYAAKIGNTNPSWIAFCGMKS